MSACAACLFASVMVEGESLKLPERERYAFAFATGIGHALAAMKDAPIVLCPEHAKDAAASCNGLLDEAVAELAEKRKAGSA